MAATIKTLAVLNPNFHFEHALNLITTDTPDNKHTVAIEGENHQKRYRWQTFSIIKCH